jgi:hypothetical protein
MAKQKATNKGFVALMPIDETLTGHHHMLASIATTFTSGRSDEPV